MADETSKPIPGRLKRAGEPDNGSSRKNHEPSSSEPSEPSSREPSSREPSSSGAGEPSGASSPAAIRSGGEARPEAIASVSQPRARRRTKEEMQAAKAASNEAYRSHAKGAAAAAARLTEAEKSASVLLTVVETLGITLAGEGAALQEHERMLAEQSLPQVLAKLTPEAVKQIESITYPGMLVIAAGSYALRVAGLLQARAAARKAEAAALARPRPASSPEAQAQAEAPANGSSPAQALPGADVLASPDGRAFITSRGI